MNTLTRCALTEEFSALNRQADPALRADAVFLIECGPKALAYSERPSGDRPGVTP